MWNALRRIFRRILNIRLYLKDPNQSIFRKILIFFGIIYLLSPLDLVPEPVFGAGIVDDVVLWLFILSYMAKELDSYHGKEPISREARRKYRGTTVYEAEARVIQEEEVQSEGEKQS